MNNKSIEYIKDLEARFPDLDISQVTKAIEILIECYQKGGKLLIAGNGGSASDSLHIVGELMKGFVNKRMLDEDLKARINDEKLANSLQKGLPAIALVSEAALITAVINDNDPDTVFAQQVLGYAKPNDVVWLISTSGNSRNCVNALKVANALGIKSIGLTGRKESELSRNATVTIRAPRDYTYQIQEVHLPIYHTICLVLESEFFGE